MLILVALCCYGAWEYRSHQQRLRRIPIRIHVNGSRGKSSVTRLIAAGLRAGDIRTVAKTTGTLPRIIDHDGKEISIARDQRANIIEQVKILHYIERYKPDALVIECMAVLPELQWFCEHKIVHSTIGVITNSRLDHINEMGHFREQIAFSLANTIPKKGALFTSEKSNLDVFKKVCKKRSSVVHRVGGAGVTLEELKNFDYIEHPANIGLALSVCMEVGIERQTALEGMYRVSPDAGALRVALCREEDKEVLFVNAMAANDPESTLVIWKEISERFEPLGRIILMLNSRADRQDRSVQLIEMAVKHIEFDYIILTGESLHKFQGYITRYKIPRQKVVGLGRTKPERVYEEIFKLIDGKGTALGMGNMGAGGIDIFRYFYKNRRTVT